MDDDLHLAKLQSRERVVVLLKEVNEHFSSMEKILKDWRELKETEPAKFIQALSLAEGLIELHSSEQQNIMIMQSEYTKAVQDAMCEPVDAGKLTAIQDIGKELENVTNRYGNLAQQLNILVKEAEEFRKNPEYTDMKIPDMKRKSSGCLVLILAGGILTGGVGIAVAGLTKYLIS